ncbi:hypothetical protein FHG87_019138 [Trinorchestia longiramus]|nr:hypothetical protein FHG87_019138 [Trinorchestia longiramus]
MWLDGCLSGCVYPQSLSIVARAVEGGSVWFMSRVESHLCCANHGRVLFSCVMLVVTHYVASHAVVTRLTAVASNCSSGDTYVRQRHNGVVKASAHVLQDIPVEAVYYSAMPRNNEAGDLNIEGDSRTTKSAFSDENHTRTTLVSDKLMPIDAKTDLRNTLPLGLNKNNKRRKKREQHKKRRKQKLYQQQIRHQFAGDVRTKLPSGLRFWPKRQVRFDPIPRLKARQHVIMPQEERKSFFNASGTSEVRPNLPVPASSAGALEERAVSASYDTGSAQDEQGGEKFEKNRAKSLSESAPSKLSVEFRARGKVHGKAESETVRRTSETGSQSLVVESEGHLKIGSTSIPDSYLQQSSRFDQPVKVVLPRLTTKTVPQEKTSVLNFADQSSKTVFNGGKSAAKERLRSRQELHANSIRSSGSSKSSSANSNRRRTRKDKADHKKQRRRQQQRLFQQSLDHFSQSQSILQHRNQQRGRVLDAGVADAGGLQQMVFREPLPQRHPPEYYNTAGHALRDRTELSTAIRSSSYGYGFANDGTRAAIVRVSQPVRDYRGEYVQTVKDTVRGTYSSLGPVQPAEGNFLQMHPMDLCGRLTDPVEYGWVGFVKPEGALLSSCDFYQMARNAITRGATALLVDVSGLSYASDGFISLTSSFDRSRDVRLSGFLDAAGSVKDVADPLSRPVVFLPAQEANKLWKVLE